MNNPHDIPSKLPENKISIFSKMSKMASDHDAINLSQGFPNFETDAHLKELVTKAMYNGYNQYPPSPGLLELREEIVKKIESLYGKSYDPVSEVTLSVGATQAIYSAISAFIHPGDEAIVLKPAYDSYEPTIKVNGGKPVLVQLQGENFNIPWEELASKINSHTKMLIINTPHNPTGTILKRKDMLKLQSLLDGTNIILLSDEVYEHLIFDDLKHQSASKFTGLASRAVVCASFGKTFHNTGWKTGYCVAPDYLMKEIRKIHEVTVFSVNSPMQKAYAEYLKEPRHYLELNNFYQKKRDLFLDLIKDSKFRWTPAKGTYFQLLNYSEITKENDVTFAERLVTDYGLASIPISVFNINNQDHKQLRFCFAKTGKTLSRAAEILCKL